jgi:hypothetical protein
MRYVVLPWWNSYNKKSDDYEKMDGLSEGWHENKKSEHGDDEW